MDQWCNMDILPITEDNPNTDTPFSIKDIKQETTVETEPEQVIVHDSFVYTTRLESMDILNEQLGGYTAVYINDRILAESKPTYRGPLTTHDSSTNKRARGTKIYSLSYHQMSCKIKAINRKGRFKTYGSHKSVKVATSSDPAAVNPADASQDETMCSSSSHYQDHLPLKEFVDSVKNEESKFVEPPLHFGFKHSQEFELSERSRQLLKRCKPLNIVLVDFRKEINKQLSLNNKTCAVSAETASKPHQQVINLNMQQDKPFSHPEINLVEKRHNTAIIKPPVKKIKFANEIDVDELQGTLLLDRFSFYFIDFHTGQMEIHFVFSNNTLGYYKLDDYKNRLDEYIPLKYSKKICCWYYRKALLEKVCKYQAHFMGEVHRCDFNSCICCCKDINQTILFDLHKHVPITELATDEGNKIKELENEITNAIGQTKPNIIINYHMKLQKLLEEVTKDAYHKGLIYKALAFNVPTVYTALRSTMSNKCGNLEFKIIRIVNMMSKKLRMEYYKIGEDGDVILKFDVDPLKDKSLCKDLNEHLFGNTVVCCWYNHANYMSFLQIGCTLSAAALSLMKKPHLCPLENCCCCCKPVKNDAPPHCLVDIDLPNHAGQSGNFINVDQRKRKLQNLIKNTVALQRLKKNFKNKKRSNAEKKVNDSNTVAIKPNNASRNVENDGDISDTAIEVQVLSEINAPELKMNVSKVKINDPGVKFNAPAPINTSIRSILNKIENIPLRIHENKTVTVALKQLVTGSTSKELKVLEELINIARHHVTSLASISNVSIKNVIDMEIARKGTAHINETLMKCLNPDLNISGNEAVNNTKQQLFVPRTPKVRTQRLLDENKSLEKTKENSVIDAEAGAEINIREEPTKIDANACKIFSNIQCNKFQCYQHSFINVIYKRNENVTPKISNVYSLANETNVVDETDRNNDKVQNISNDKPKICDVSMNSASSISKPKKTAKRSHKPIRGDLGPPKAIFKKPKLNARGSASSCNVEYIELVDLTEDSEATNN